MKEETAITDTFPNARVLLCQFHVLKWFQKKRTEFDLDRQEQNELSLMIRTLVYASSLESYVTNRDQFFSKLIKKNKTDFIQYFNKNWESCKEKWVLYHRTDCLHMGNNTNNRIESAWGKIKLALSYRTPLDEAVGEILVSQMLKESDFTSKQQQSALRTRIRYDWDEEMNKVSDVATSYAANLVAEQYEYAKKVRWVQ